MLVNNITALALRLAEENNLDWKQLEGTGPNGRIMERDVLEKLAEIMRMPPQPTRIIDLEEVLNGELG